VRVAKGNNTGTLRRSLRQSTGFQKRRQQRKRKQKTEKIENRKRETESRKLETENKFDATHMFPKRKDSDLS